MSKKEMFYFTCDEKINKKAAILSTVKNNQLPKVIGSSKNVFQNCYQKDIFYQSFYQCYKR